MSPRLASEGSKTRWANGTEEEGGVEEPENRRNYHGSCLRAVNVGVREGENLRYRKLRVGY